MTRVEVDPSEDRGSYHDDKEFFRKK